MTTARDVAKAFLKLSDPDAGDVLTNLKLQKLVYYTQGFHLAINNAPLFNEDIVAWEYGPVVLELYRALKEFGSSQVALEDDFDPSQFTEDELDLIAEVNKVYGQFSAWKLRDMTHNESPWLTTHKNDIISHDKMTSYFKTQLA